MHLYTIYWQSTCHWTDATLCMCLCAHNLWWGSFIFMVCVHERWYNLGIMLISRLHNEAFKSHFHLAKWTSLSFHNCLLHLALIGFITIRTYIIHLHFLQLASIKLSESIVNFYTPTQTTFPYAFHVNCEVSSDRKCSWQKKSWNILSLQWTLSILSWTCNVV